MCFRSLRCFGSTALIQHITNAHLFMCLSCANFSFFDVAIWWINVVDFIFIVRQIVVAWNCKPIFIKWIRNHRICQPQLLFLWLDGFDKIAVVSLYQGSLEGSRRVTRFLSSSSRACFSRTSQAENPPRRARGFVNISKMGSCVWCATSMSWHHNTEVETNSMSNPLQLWCFSDRLI